MSYGGKRPGAGRKPGKVNESTRRIREAAEPYTDEALKALVRVMRSKSAPENAVVNAAGLILAYGHGKPKQMLEHSSDPGRPMALHVTRTIIRAAVAPSA